MKIVKRIVSVYLFLASIGGVVVILDQSISTDVATKILSGVLMAALILAGVMLWKSSSKTKAPNPEDLMKKEEAERISEERKYIKTHTFLGEHVSGLPVSEGANSSIFFNKEYVEISVSGNLFKVANSKITDVDVKTSTEIENAYTSSIGGAVGGFVLFGPLGAMVGGRSKKKQIRKTEFYFIITYSKNDTIDYLSFKIPYPGVAATISKEFKISIPNTRTEIEL